MYQIWSFIYKIMGINKPISNKEKTPRNAKIDSEISIIESRINQTELFQDFQKITNIDGRNIAVPSIIKYLEKEKLYMTKLLEIKKKDNLITIDEVIYNTHIKELLHRFQLLHKLLELKKDSDWYIINN